MGSEVSSIPTKRASYSGIEFGYVPDEYWIAVVPRWIIRGDNWKRFDLGRTAGGGSTRASFAWPYDNDMEKRKWLDVPGETDMDAYLTKALTERPLLMNIALITVHPDGASTLAVLNLDEPPMKDIVPAPGRVPLAFALYGVVKAAIDANTITLADLGTFVTVIEPTLREFERRYESAGIDGIDGAIPMLRKMGMNYDKYDVDGLCLEMNKQHRAGITSGISQALAPSQPEWSGKADDRYNRWMNSSLLPTNFSVYNVDQVRASANPEALQSKLMYGDAILVATTPCDAWGGQIDHMAQALGFLETYAEEEEFMHAMSWGLGVTEEELGCWRDRKALAMITGLTHGHFRKCNDVLLRDLGSLAKQSLWEYSKSSDTVNEMLRDLNPESRRLQLMNGGLEAANMVGVLNMMPRLPGDAWTCRGLFDLRWTGCKKPRVGNTIIDAGFSSMSINNEVCSVDCGQEMKYVLWILLPAGTRLVPLWKMCHKDNKWQLEVLTYPGMKLRVVHVVGNDVVCMWIGNIYGLDENGQMDKSAIAKVPDVSEGSRVS